MPGVDHALALDGEHEVGIRAELVGDGHLVLDPVLGDDRRAGGDLADQRQDVDRSAARHRPRRRLRLRPPSITSSARGLVVSRRIRPAPSSRARCACTVEGDVRPTAWPISRTVGG